METKIQKITPKMAAKWLAENNDGNRGIRKDRVALLVRAILGNRWVPTHQGIAFDTDGNLIDGQHRLSAIVEAGQPVQLMVTTGLPREAMIAMDRGAVRDTGDTLHLLHGIDNARFKTSLARIILAIKAGVNYVGYTVDDGEIEAHLQSFDDHYNWLFEIEGWQKLKYAPFAAALVYAYPARPDKVTAFTKAIIDPAHLPSKSPVFHAIDILHTRRGSGGGRRFIAFRTALRCIKAYCEGETLRKIVDNQIGLEYFRQLRTGIDQ